MAGPAVTARDKTKKFLADFFNAEALPADAVPHHRRGKHGARIEQRREDRTHVSKHQSREGDGRGVSGLLPPSRWHLGKNRAGRRETERGKHSVWEKRRVEWRKSEARKKRRRRRRIRRAAHKIRTDARARSRAGDLVVGTYNVRTLAFKGTNGIGHAEVILKTCEDAGCDVIGLQEVRRNGESAFTAAGYVVFCSGADGGKYKKKGNHGVGLVVSLSWQGWIRATSRLSASALD